MTKQLKEDRINMFWHKVPFGKKNFGDVLGPYIVQHLSGKEPMYTPLLHVKPAKKVVLTYLRALYNQKLSFKEMYYNVRYLSGKRNSLLISIGSIIDWYTNPNCDIWGSGIMFRNSKITNANFHAVRGKYSQLRLKELGYKVPKVIGDPALLTPLIYQPKSEKKYKLGIIPHFLHYEETITKLKSDSIYIINILDDIEKVIDDVHACEKIISSSLHGIIIGHAYHVPSLWFNLASSNIGGDDIKFADYFSSVQLEEYQNFKIDHLYYDEKFWTEVTSIFDKNEHLTLISPVVLTDIQKNLLQSAPFPLLPKYSNLIK